MKIARRGIRWIRGLFSKQQVTTAKQQPPKRRAKKWSNRMRMNGTVKFFNQSKGFGFIKVPGGDDLFVHVSEVSGELNDNDEVEFTMGQGKKGPMATEVQVTKRSDSQGQDDRRSRGNDARY